MIWKIAVVLERQAVHIQSRMALESLEHFNPASAQK
jgi:hypothetical protein